MFELKEKAKWSRDIEEKKLAITGMLSHGTTALSALEEVCAISAYEDIRSACIEAIKAIKGESDDSAQTELQSSQHGVAISTDVESTKIVKKKQANREDGLVASEKLADLPP